MAKKLADGVKGIDDLLAAVGPELVSSLLANAKVITKAKPRTKACVTEISSRNG